MNIKVIGIGEDGPGGLSGEAASWIGQCEVLVGGERQLAFYPDFAGETWTLKGGLSELTGRLAAETRRTAVLASGDPLFYGIGVTLSRRLPGKVEIVPAVSSLQLAFARAGEGWHDAYTASVHGRSMLGLAQRIDGRAKVALLTDERNSPDAIARYLIEYGMTEYRAFVGENLGGPKEKTGWYSLAEMAESSFSPLNVVLLIREGESPKWPMGIDDEEFAQRKPDRGLITKKEIRVLSLAKLGLREDSVVWDIGAGSGSVAVEAARIAREGAVYAIEKNEPDLELIRSNMRKFRTDFTLVAGRAPAGLDAFADPDAVFIGGSGGELRELLGVCCSRLKQRGTLVMNAATIENLSEAQSALKELGMETDILLAQVSRSKPILHMTRFEGLNPIYIITARRKPEQDEQENGGSGDE
ncbi:precorrin-6y C5,15-methyltransferase (decarboxylating) subunit CbiE [Paenibacillus filicis]|uniref:Precorrin-6y C5,15-methyltransferase (Decarboxylating) subunit CbiE n=1 Tax=Paenibacillus gyeongsangnamensis TaxID=3388067 RepID=A0ABT4QHI2_9BACL|nr:precorrin-6y C5,15-methyltransferase (decarboxylating) subunit CbiE [Paenibacillus filicis]MCZ8516349.1 precorrin-6y C5,15-methyltransferase (decarboxylating) subunit CbiE [Paenibacillus filicis]